MVLEKNVYNEFLIDFNRHLYDVTQNNNYSNIIFFCVGTDRVTGDSFGPIVGQKLTELCRNLYNVDIIGNLELPVSCSNIKEKINCIKKSYERPCIIAIDAALSKKEDIGKIITTKGSMCLGRGLNKNIATIGDISIKGVVAKDLKIPKYNLKTLQSTSLNLVINLADITAQGIYEVIKYI